MYFFDLRKSNIKSEPLAQETSKRKVFLKISRTDWKTTVSRSLFYNTDAECIKPNFYVHIIPGKVFPSEIWEIFKNTFENTINFVKCYL